MKTFISFKKILHKAAYCLVLMLALGSLVSCDSEEDRTEVVLMTVSSGIIEHIPVVGNEVVHKRIAIKEDNAAGWLTIPLNFIENFNYESGYEYRLRVLKTYLSNSLADGFDVTYKLLEILSTSEDKPDLTEIKIVEKPCETLEFAGKIGGDFDSALEELKKRKNIFSEIIKDQLDVLFDYDDRKFYGIVYDDCGIYTDVIDTKGNYYLRSWYCSGEKDIYQEPVQDGIYSGTFTVRYFSDVWYYRSKSGETALELKDGKYTCTGNPDRVPAGGSGNYSINNNKISFKDVNLWVADFDANLILEGEYHYFFDGKKLKIFAYKNGIGYYEYDLEKEEKKCGCN